MDQFAEFAPYFSTEIYLNQIWPNFKNNFKKMILQTAAAKQNGTKEKHLAFEVTSVDEVWKSN